MIRLARLLRRDVGLGKLKTYEGDNYEVFSLPSPERRFGATCQVVTYEVKSPRGRHIYFRYPHGRR